VAQWRSSAGRHPEDRQLNELIGELSVRSPEFRRWWADHNVRKHSTGTKHFHHPVVGDLTVGFESLYVGDNLEQNLVAYTVEPNSPLPKRSDCSPAGRPPRPQTRRPHLGTVRTKSTPEPPSKITAMLARMRTGTPCQGSVPWKVVRAPARDAATRLARWAQGWTRRK
jgi:hypothetical protein